MNITRSTRKSKIKSLAKLSEIRKKMTLSIVSILSCVCLLFVGGVASTVDPNVEVDNPITYTSDIAFEKNPEGVEFYIRTYQDLQFLANLVSANAVITGTNIGYSSATYTLINDITNTTGESMNPIGTTTSPFTGTFNGNGHTIDGIKVSGDSNVGLFGVTNGATISNVKIESGTISGSTNNIGGIVGYANNTTITSSYNKATITGASQVGGLVGLLTNSNIFECANLANVSGASFVGGLAGSVIANSTESQIMYSFNAGNVSGTSVVGGLVGSAVGTSETLISIKNGYSVAKLTTGADAIVASYEHVDINSLYYLENMGATSSTGAEALSGANMSGIDAIGNGRLLNLDTSYWVPIANDDNAYNLPKLKSLNIGAVLYKLTYNTNSGTITNTNASTYTTYFKLIDEITFPIVTRNGFNFGGWQDQNGNLVTTNDIKGNAKSLNLTAIWNILQPDVTITDSQADHKRERKTLTDFHSYRN